MDPTQPLTAAATSVASISNYWQVIALVVIGAFGVFGLWITRVGVESKKMVAMSDELESKRTEARKLERDKQMADLESRTASRISGVENSLKAHVDAHGERDERIQKSVNRLDERLYQIELNMIKGNDFAAMQGDMKKLERLVTRIHTILEVRDSKERSTGVKLEHDE